tara:strand:- start:365 stop:610 length:246 start_codon:yes stop_codon:yes gene_type:complete
MDNLWNRLKPEYKMIIQEYIDSGIYKSAPQSIRTTLQDNIFWGELTIETVRDFFVWTNMCLTDMDWEDMFGDRFLNEETNK